MLELTILVLTLCWLLSFFGQSLWPGIAYTGRFTDILAVVVAVLILFRFLT